MQRSKYKPCLLLPKLNQIYTILDFFIDSTFALELVIVR